MERKEGKPTLAEAAVREPAPESAAHRFWRRLRRNFLTGLVVLLPVVVTVFVLWRLFSWLDLLLGRYVMEYLGYAIPGVGVVALFLIIVGIGALASNILGRRLIGAGESIVERVPILRWIYRTTKQLFSTLLQGRKTNFGKVVLVTFPYKGTYSMAFQTSDGSDAVDRVLGKRMVTVFLPTTPNPTSGYFLLVPEDEVIPLGISADEGLKYIISAGAIARECDFPELD
ncbi:MAG: DUF502 domain-containing protein [Candidatus Eisenbacteria bacterium]|nr:DUF502 domain-containing protein [Candidatus Eisenbacteria bacterium]